MYMSETTAEFDMCTVSRVWTENSGLSADPFDFPVLSSAPQRSAGRLPPYHPLRRIRQCKLNRVVPWVLGDSSDLSKSDEVVQ